MNYVLRGTVSWQPPMRQDAVRRGGSEGDVMDACIQAINDAVEDFLTADEVFMTGNYSKVAPVVQLDERSYPEGPVAKKARELYWEWAHSTSAA